MPPVDPLRISYVDDAVILLVSLFHGVSSNNELFLNCELSRVWKKADLVCFRGCITLEYDKKTAATFD